MSAYKGTLVKKIVSVNLHEVSHSYSRHPTSIMINQKNCVAAQSIIPISPQNSEVENISSNLFLKLIQHWSQGNTFLMLR